MAINEQATVEVKVNGEQAKQELKNLESYANSLKGRLAEAYKAGDTKQIKKLEADLKKTNAELKTMRTNAKNIDVAMNNIGLATPKELRSLLKDINAKLNSGHIKRGSAEWKKYQEQIKLVNAEIRKVNAEVKETEGWLTRFNNKFSRWGALAASGIAAITGVSLALSKMRNDRNEKESSAANLKALTGLDDISIQWLTRQAEILSTTMDKTGLRVTQSSKDILEAYMLVGSAKPDLLSNKEALNEVTIEAMRLSRAAKMDLKEAVDAVTLSMNQYGASADRAAVYTNVMAAGSKFGSAAVQSITAAVTKAGVSASGANVSIEELVGTIETLAEKGIKDEVAGTGLKMFFLRLQTGADETNPKVVGLQKALQNLQKLSVEEILKRFGAETYTVAKTLIDGAEKVDYYTKAVTGTNVAIEQAAINSNTAEARMAQLKNQIRESGILLMEKLNPSLSMLTGWATKFIKVAPNLIDWFGKWGKSILFLSAIYAIYVTRMKIAMTYTTALNAVTKVATIVKLAYGIAMTTVSGYTVTSIQNLRRLYVAMAAHPKLLTVLRVATYAYAAAVQVLHGRLDLAAKAMKGAWAIMAANPIGLLATALLAAVAASYKLTQNISDYYNLEKINLSIQEKTKKSIEEQTSEIDKLTGIINDNSTSIYSRKKALIELKEIIPDYKADLTEEGELINNNTEALEKYNKTLALNAELKAVTEQLNEHRINLLKLQRQSSISGSDNSLMGSLARMDHADKLKKEEEIVNSLTEQYKELVKEKWHALNPRTKVTDADDEKKCPICGNYPCTCKKGLSEEEKQKKLREELKNKEAAAAKEEANIKARYAQGKIGYRDYCKAINENDIHLLDEKMSLYDKESNEYNQLLSKKQDLLKAGLEQETKFTIEEIEARTKAEEIELVSSYNERKIGRYALNEGLFQLDMKALQQKRALYTKDSKEWYEYEKQIVDLENNEKLRKQKEYQVLLASIRDEYSKKNLDQLMKEELDGIDLLYKENLLKEEEYLKLQQLIKFKYAGLEVEESNDNAERGLRTARNKATHDSDEEGAGDSFWGSLFGQDKDIHQKTLDNLQALWKTGALTQKEYLAAMAEENNNYFNNLAEKIQDYYSQINGVVSAYSNFSQASSELEVAKIEKRYDAEIEAAGNNKDKVAKLEKEKDKAIAAEKTKANKRSTTIQIAQALAETAMSAIRAYAAGWEAGFPAGPILAPLFAGMAVAAGMLQVATIRKQAQAQQMGYYSGGFTARGDYRKEVGVVHAGEFVADHRAVNNANILPVLRLIDNAQKNNTIGSLTAADISRTISGSPVTTSSPVAGATNNVNNEPLLNMLNYTYNVIEKLETRLNEPFITVNTVDGDHGIKQAMDKYERTIKIKSR